MHFDRGGFPVPKIAASKRARDSAADIGHACAHPIRTDILTVLHDGLASPSGLAAQLREPLSNIGHHIKALLAANAIELAHIEPKGSGKVHYYRPLTTSTYYEKELAELTWEEHYELSRIVIQSIIAELLAALRAGNLAGDPLAATAWDRVPLDRQGYKDLSDSTGDFLDRMYEIADESDGRIEKSGESPSTYVGAVMVYKRSRTKPAISSAVEPADLILPTAEPRHLPRDSALDIGDACAHRIRTDILTILHDGPASLSRLASEMGEPIGNVTHHIEKLLRSDAIEVALTELTGTHEVAIYRALQSSIYYENDLAKLTGEEHYELSRIVSLSITAEVLAALRAGHLAGDPLAATAWDRVSLDRQGYKDLSDSTGDFLNRMYEIREESKVRIKTSKEDPLVYVGTVMAFKRNRTKPAISATVGDIGGVQSLR